MNTIKLGELSGYQEDSKGLQDFQRAYLAPSLFGFAVTLAGLVLLFAEFNAHDHSTKGGFLAGLWLQYGNVASQIGASGLLWYFPPILFVTGMAIFFLTMVWMGMASPKSSISGQTMEKYWNGDAAPGVSEIVYVDRSSRTYFRRVFATRNSRGVIAR